jgi:hypothetical protein
MARILVQLDQREQLAELKQYGKVLFVSSFTDVVGMESTEAEIEEIRRLVGPDRVRPSDRGRIQRRAA